MSAPRRVRLDNRRPALTTSVRHKNKGLLITLTTCLINGCAKEVFLGSSVGSGTDLEAILHDVAIALSVSFQNSVTVQSLAHSVKRLPDGQPSSVVGTVLDVLRRLELEEGSVAGDVGAALSTPRR